MTARDRDRSEGEGFLRMDASMRPSSASRGFDLTEDGWPSSRLKRVAS